MEAKKEEADCCAAPKQTSRTDLFCGGKAILLWCVPGCALILGLSWTAGRTWLWIGAFAVMGVACVANAAQCGRLHCYVTGPLYLLVAIYTALAAFGAFPLHPVFVLAIVLAITVGAVLAERPLGTHRRKE